MSRQRHSRRSFGVDDPNFLIPSADISLPSTQIQSTAGLVTSWQNVGLLGDAADVDTIVGTAANLRVHPSGSILFGGSAGDYVSTGDSPAASITGDIDIRVKLAMDDWTPSTTETFLAKAKNTSNRAYFFDVTNSGTLNFTTDADGASSGQVSVQSTSSTGFSNGTSHWIRATRDVDNGASGNDTTFYTSEDGLSWTQLGDVITTAGVTSIVDNDSAVEIGSLFLGTAQVTKGNVYSAKIYNGIDPDTQTLAVSFNAADAGQANGLDGDTFTSGGVTWTTHGNTFANNTGHTGVKFLGSAVLHTDVFADIPTPRHIFMVGETDITSGSGDELFVRGYQTNTSVGLAVYSNSSDSDNFTVYDGTVVSLATEDNDLHLWSLANNGDATSSGQVSGTAAVVGVQGSLSLARLALGGTITASSSLKGSMYALYIFKQRVLPPPTIERLERFLTP